MACLFIQEKCLSITSVLDTVSGYSDVSVISSLVSDGRTLRQVAGFNSLRDGPCYFGRQSGSQPPQKRFKGFCDNP